ncbi:TPA: hypothetical protein ACH3X3_014160 [Trebouxia sp. C0006]
MAMSSQQEAACVCVHITAKATSFPYREASRDAAVFAVAISAGFLAHLDPFGNLHWDSMDAVQGLAWAGPNIAVDAALLVPKYTARMVTKVVTTTADDIARDQAAQAKFAAERQALHMSPEEPFALLGQSSPGEEVSPGIHQKEVTVTQQQAAWRDGLGKWRWDRANKEPRVAVQMPLPTVYSMVSVVASEMLLRAVTLAGLARLLASNKYIAGVEVIQLDRLWTESSCAHWAAVIVMAAWPLVVGIFEYTPFAFTEDNYVVMPDVSRQLRQHPEAERQRIEQKTQSCLQDITYVSLMCVM